MYREPVQQTQNARVSFYEFVCFPSQLYIVVVFISFYHCRFSFFPFLQLCVPIVCFFLQLCIVICSISEPYFTFFWIILREIILMLQQSCRGTSVMVQWFSGHSLGSPSDMVVVCTSRRCDRGSGILSCPHYKLKLFTVFSCPYYRLLFSLSKEPCDRMIFFLRIL